MGKPLKIIVSIVTALIFLAVTAAGAFYLFFDPNDYKSEITSIVKEKTGRDLVLEGELKISLFPLLGISASGVALTNAQGFEDQSFATIEESSINIKLLPLFAKKIEINRIMLKNMVLNLARNREGMNNWQDLTAINKSNSTPPAVSGNNRPAESNLLKAFVLGAITIENARINWDNRQTGKRMEIKDINLKTSQFNVSEPVAVNLSLLVLNSAATVSESIKLTTEVIVNEKLDGFIISHGNLLSITEGAAIPGKSLAATLNADVAVDLPSQTVKISGLQLRSGDMTLSAELRGTGIKDHPFFQGPVRVEPFSPAKVLKEWSVALPVMKDSNALNQLALNFDLQASENSAVFQNILINFDESQIKGLIEIKNLAQAAVDFHLSIDSIDADRYLPPTTKKHKPISSPAAALAAGASLVPVEVLRKLNVNGELSLQQLKISDLTLQDINLKLAARNGNVSTHQSVKRFYQGSYSGNLSIDANSNEPILALNERVNNVQIEPLLKDYQSHANMSGMVNASAKLKGQGRNAATMKSSLDGQVNIKIQDSVIKGFNLQKIIDNGKALVKGTPITVDQKNDQTLFSDITGTANVKQGVIQNDDLIARSSKLRVTGEGNANLTTEKLDYQIIARLIKTEATATEPEQLHDTPVIIHIGGTLSEPAYTLDAASLLTEKNKAKVEKILNKNKDKIDKLIEKLDKKLGPGATDLLKRLF